jgi:hypothetical protein
MKRLFVYLLVLLVLIVSVSAECSVEIAAESADAFLDDLNDVNSGLEECPQQVPSPLHYFFKNERVAVYLDMTDGSRETAIAVVEDAVVKEVTEIGLGDGYFISIDECAFNTMLREDNRVGVFMYAYQEGRATIGGESFSKKIFALFGKLLLNFVDVNEDLYPNGIC